MTLVVQPVKQEVVPLSNTINNKPKYDSKEITQLTAVLIIWDRQHVGQQDGCLDGERPSRDVQFCRPTENTHIQHPLPTP